ncbi:MAG: trehalose-phosphatase [Stellaceae bacterium]
MRSDLPSLAPDWALFLDIDGTLIDFAPRPDLVQVPAELRLNLVTLHTALDGAVALVSGRASAVIDALFAPDRFAVAGQHGAELRLDDEQVRLPRNPHLAPIAAALAAFAHAHDGLVFEDKGDSIALHYRLAPELEGEVEWLAGKLVAAAGPEFQLLSSHMAVDIKQRSATKGSAILWFMARPPFAGRIPVFFGDDRTDEDGFAAVNAWGGYSVHVGAREDSIARFRLQSPADVRQWLRRQAGAYAPETA